MVASAESFGVTSDVDDSDLFNQGSIVSASDGLPAVALSGDNGSLTNAEGARIIGALVGVNLDGTDPTLANHGAILGLAGNGVELDFGANGASLVNDGTISGRDNALINSSDFSGNTIENSGLISSDNVGINANTDPGMATIIINSAGGIVHGGVDAISADGGHVSLNNAGLIAGAIDLRQAAAENDIIVNHGRIAGEVSLGDGNDIFLGRGGSSGFVDGGTGDDRLVGGRGNDSLDGGFGTIRSLAAQAMTASCSRAFSTRLTTLIGLPISHPTSTGSSSTTNFSCTSAAPGRLPQPSFISAPLRPTAVTASSTTRTTGFFSTTPTARAASRRYILRRSARTMLCTPRTSC